MCGVCILGRERERDMINFVIPFVDNVTKQDKMRSMFSFGVKILDHEVHTVVYCFTIFFIITII